MKKVILITGASRGIGNNIARSLAHENIVIANYNKSKDEAKKLKADLKSENIDIDIIKADVSNRTEVKEMIEGIITKYGKIDVLINNAGISQYKLFTDITDEDWENIMNINLKSNFIVTQEVVENMIANKNGLIINISSIGGSVPDISRIGYGVSKSGVNNITQQIAMQYAKNKIRCNAVLPGMIATDAVASNMPEDFQKSFLSHVPLNRMGKPEDIANAVAFFASDDSSYITGCVMEVSGGYHLGTPQYADFVGRKVAENAKI